MRSDRGHQSVTLERYGRDRLRRVGEAVFLHARIVRDTEKKQNLWMKDLKRWFDEGPESDAIVLIKVTPTFVSYWTRNDEGELRIT